MHYISNTSWCNKIQWQMKVFHVLSLWNSQHHFNQMTIHRYCLTLTFYHKPNFHFKYTEHKHIIQIHYIIMQLNMFWTTGNIDYNNNSNWLTCRSIWIITLTLIQLTIILLSSNIEEHSCLTLTRPVRCYPIIRINVGKYNRSTHFMVELWR